MQLEHPGGAPQTKLERLTGHGDEWTLEATLDYGPERGGIYHLVKTIAFKDGKVIRETRYFAEPFQAPEGRAKWTKGAAADPRDRCRAARWSGVRDDQVELAQTRRVGDEVDGGDLLGAGREAVDDA